ncbi:hypothetical protein B0H19DRAFT_1088730, partial [Mycena capillaripes]
PGGGGDGAGMVHAIPTHALQGTHPTPHAVPPTPGDASASTPSLVPSTGGDSGYAASTEPGSNVATPGEVEAAFSPISTPGLPQYAQQPAYGAAAGVGVQAPNSSGVPEVDSAPNPAPTREAEGDDPTFGVQGSAALNSSRVADNVPTGDFDAPTGGVSQDADADAEGDADGDADEDAEEEQEGGDNDGKKKPKLIQRLKEKMHVGGGGGGSA